MEASDRLSGEEVRRTPVPLNVLVSDAFPLSGGVSHGPRGPTSYYYLLPMKVRVQGLKVALSSKVTQVGSAPQQRGLPSCS